MRWPGAGSGFEPARAFVNGLTASRAFAGPVVAASLLVGNNRAAFWLFLAAILTDLVDGRLAGMLPGPNPTGVWLDPISDKVLTLCSWTALGVHGWAPWGLVAIIWARDLLIGGLWVGGRRTVHPAAQVGVAFEGVALCLYLFHGPWVGVHWSSAGFVLAGISLLLFGLSLPRYALETRS